MVRAGHVIINPSVANAIEPEYPMDTYNATVDQKVVCVYPVSSQYGLLPRLLYYTLIVVSVFPQRHFWARRCAIASALTYSSTTAIHPIALAAVSVNSVFDLDTVGVWAVVSAGCVAVIPILDWSKTLLHSQVIDRFLVFGDR